MQKDIFKTKIWNINTNNFENTAMEIFHWQANHNTLYKTYLSLLRKNINNISTIQEIPFMPISFFKIHKVKTGEWNEKICFLSSTTTRNTPSQHFLDDISFYKKISTTIFETFYQKIENCIFIALLPSYLERKNSSLVFMVDAFMKQTKNNYSRYFLYNDAELVKYLISIQNKNTLKVLLGVSFALLHLAKKHELDLNDFIVMETGGMKGKEKEITREELHMFLCQRFHIKKIHSEYGMTELLSQCYSYENGIFFSPPWVKILIREVTDPFSYNKEGITGGVNIIDLANIHSCCFIETQDLGKKNSNNSFSILGRIDHSDIRGCNLLTF